MSKVLSDCGDERMMRCMLDLDGVLVDFLAGAHRYYDLPYSYEDYPYELGNYHNCPPPNGEMTTREFWDGLDEEFWENIPWMHDGRELLAAVEQALGAVCAKSDNPAERIYACSQAQCPTTVISWAR